jgi:hypothetical protein
LCGGRAHRDQSCAHQAGPPMLDDMLAAASQIFTPRFRKVMAKTLLMTFGLLGLVFVGGGSELERLLSDVGHVALCVAHGRDHDSRRGRTRLRPRLSRRADLLRRRRIFLRRARRSGRARPYSARATRESHAFQRGAPRLPAFCRSVPRRQSRGFGASAGPGLDAFAFFGTNAYLLWRGTFELAAGARHGGLRLGSGPEPAFPARLHSFHGAGGPWHLDSAPDGAAFRAQAAPCAQTSRGPANCPVFR